MIPIYRWRDGEKKRVCNGVMVCVRVCVCERERERVRERERERERERDISWMTWCYPYGMIKTENHNDFSSTKHSIDR